MRMGSACRGGHLSDRPPPVKFPDAIDRAAFRVLWGHLGLWRALRLGVSLQRRVDRGEPFADLPPATDAREAGSRAQAGPAVLLYRLLRERGRRAIGAG